MLQQLQTEIDQIFTKHKVSKTSDLSRVKGFKKPIDWRNLEIEVEVQRDVVIAIQSDIDASVKNAVKQGLNSDDLQLLLDYIENKFSKLL